MAGELPSRIEQFRKSFRNSPATAYREWFRLQEELADRPDLSRALAEDLWRQLPELEFDSDDDRARFFHNVGVFFGSPGPAADLERARACFGVTLEHFAKPDAGGWRARALHNLATATSNLGATAGELEEAASLFAQALEWRTSEREIARAVTLHNLGVALRRLADIVPDGAEAVRDRSEAILSEAIAIRRRLGLAEGELASRRELDVLRRARTGLLPPGTPDGEP